MPSKLELPLSSIQTALATISPAIDSKITLPVLGNVRIEELDGAVAFTGTNLDLSIRTVVPCEGVRAGGIHLLAAKRLRDYTRILDEDPVAFSFAEKIATLKCGRANTKLPLDIAANYPQVSFADAGEGQVSIPRDVFSRMLAHVLISVSEDDSPFALNGALLHCSRGKAVLVATDGHRMSLHTYLCDNVLEARYLLPAGMLQAIRSAPDSEGLVVIANSENDYTARLDGEVPVVISHRKLTGQFPNYEAAMFRDGGVRLEVNSSELVVSLRRCSLLAQESQPVKLTIAPDSITVECRDAMAGESEERVAAHSTDSFGSFTSGFAARYLIDPLKQIKGDVVMEWKDSSYGSPLKITSNPEPAETFEYIAMPMRV